MRIRIVPAYSHLHKWEYTFPCANVMQDDVADRSQLADAAAEGAADVDVFQLWRPTTR